MDVAGEVVSVLFQRRLRRVRMHMGYNWASLRLVRDQTATPVMVGPSWKNKNAGMLQLGS